MPPKNKSNRNCPTCGAKLAKGQKTCPKCGTESGKGPKKQGKPKSAKAGKIECPSCGAMVSKKQEECPSCGNSLQPMPEKAVAPPADEGVIEPLPDLVEPKTVETEQGKTVCPRCESVLEGTESVCPICLASLEAETKPAETPEIIHSKPAQELPQTVNALVREESKPCPVCGSLLPKSFERCPICSSTVTEVTARPEVTETHSEPAELTPPEEVAKPAPTPETRKTAPVRKRKLKSQVAAAVPPGSSTTPVGRTNGVSYGKGTDRTASAGLVNGTGAINGNSFVNGTGIPSKAERRSEARTAKRSKLVRWQFLAALIAIIIIIPTIVFISYSRDGDGFSIDGDFGDWSDATTYGTRIYSAAPSSNVTEWAVGSESSDLYLYIRTETSMMTSPDAVNFYLFVDSDGASETGYVMESIGADYMLQIMGWDSEIKATSLSHYDSLLDQYDWSNWIGIDSLSCTLDGARLEAKASMPVTVDESARFVMISKDPLDRSSISYPAPMKGGVLIVEQEVPADIASTGVITKADSITMLTLSFSCQGEGAYISEVNPALKGATRAESVQGFFLEEGTIHEIAVAVNTSAAADDQLISMEVTASNIICNFTSVEIIGSGAKAFAGTAPSVIAIDGAFADWSGLLSTDYDPIPVNDSDVDLHQVGSSNSSLASYFYVSVNGEICSGTFIPAKVAKPSNTGGGGAIVHTRHTAEDILNVYIDTDKSDVTGYIVELAPKRIGADIKVEVRGLFGVITSMTQFNYEPSTGKWEETMYEVEAAKDQKRIEIGVSAASLGGSTDIDFIVETTTWEGRSDLAVFDPSSVSMLTRTWVVDPATTSASATSLSTQRKMFFDGANYWSFYFDGTNTVYKYSTDGGVTWSTPIRAFATAGVNKVSVWYDSAAGIVYAVGDRAVLTRTVTIQRGVVDPAVHKIAWNPSDESLNVSAYNHGDKNTFISKDASGYLWIMSSNSTTPPPPPRYDLSVFKSSAVDNLKAWVWTGNLLGAASAQPTCKGSILPAGNGSDMFAVYTYAGNVASRKYTTGWTPTENMIYAVGDSLLNTENAPPSAVVDSRGVVHVVYGTGRKSGPASAPTIEYSHNNTDNVTFTPGVNLDPTIPGKVGDFYPTISLGTSTDSLFVLWLQSDNTLAPMTVMGRACVSGTWSAMTIEGQTTFTKQFLTSVYSVPLGSMICWQWTQNTTAPMQVMYDSTLVPEFSELAPLVVASMMMVVAIYGRRSRGRDETDS